VWKESGMHEATTKELRKSDDEITKGFYDCSKYRINIVEKQTDGKRSG